MPDPRYLAGIELFNRGEFFDAHDAWEELWTDTVGEDRRFFQSLIQAAVAVYHAFNGNASGARRLSGSAETYMRAYPAFHLGIDTALFWSRMHSCLDGFLAGTDPRPGPPPTITLASE